MPTLAELKAERERRQSQQSQTQLQQLLAERERRAQVEKADDASIQSIAQQSEKIQAGLSPPKVPSPMGGANIVNLYRKIKEAITGSGRQTYQTTMLPEYFPTKTKQGVESPGFDDVKKLIAFDSADTPREKMKMIKEWDPKASFDIDDKGNIIVTGEDGLQSVLNQPGLTSTDKRKIVSELAAYYPASRIAAAPKTLMGKMGAGSAASGATQTGIEAFQESEGGTFDKAPIAVSAGAGALAETISPLVTGSRNIAVRKEVGADWADEVPEFVENVDEAITAQEAIKKFTGVDVPLAKAQKTLSPHDLKRQGFLAELGPSARTAYKFLQKQDQKVGSAVDKVIDSIAPEEVLEYGARQFKTASEKAIEARKIARQEASSPLYNNAFNEGALVNTTPIKNFLDGQIDGAPKGGQIYGVMKRVERLLLMELQSSTSNVHKASPLFPVKVDLHLVSTLPSRLPYKKKVS